MILFTLGGGMTDPQWLSLSQSIDQKWHSNWPNVKFDLQFAKYTDDLSSIINAAQNPIMLIGHSYGGCASVTAATNTTKVIDQMILFDPVDLVNWDTPNNIGFAIPNNVKNTVCFYRGATEAPYSGMAHGNSVSNVLFPPSGGGPASHHGDAIWDFGTCQNMVMKLIQALPTPPTPPSNLVDLTGAYLVLGDGTKYNLVKQ